MNKDEIDELLSDLNSNDENTISKIYGVTRDDTEKMTNEQVEELVKKIHSEIMSEIEKGDYEYFIGKFEDINYSEIIGTLIEFESQLDNKEKTEWKNSIKKQVLYKIRDSKTIDEKREYDFIPLIKSIRDIDFLKECIEKRDEYGFGVWDIIEIINLVGEDEFTKECIFKREELGINNISYMIYIKLLKSISDDKIKKDCIIELQDVSYVNEIIKEFYNEEEIIEFIKTKKIEGQDLNLSSIVKLIEDINNCFELDKILSKEDKREEYGIDSDFLKELIERRDEVYLSETGRGEIVKIIDDSDYTISYIMNYWEDIHYKKDISLNLINSIEYFKDLDFIDDSILDPYQNPINCIIKKSSPEFLIEFWNEIPDDLKKQLDVPIILTLQKQECATLESIIKKLALNEDKLIELLSINGLNCLIEKSSPESLIEFWNKISDDSKKQCAVPIILTLQQNGVTLEAIIKDLALNEDKLIELLTINGLDCLIEKSSPEFLIEFWNKISDDLKGKCGTQIINALQQKGATDELVSIIKELDLNEDKLIELLTIEDSDYLKNHMINNIILRGINDKGVKLDDLNEEIDKLYNVFLTTNLPTIFKEFEFFKNHNNYGSMNYNLYEGKSISERDAIIRNDLFIIALESNNKQLRTFLENLYNGNIALTKKQNGEKVSEIDEALILKYRDILYDLLDHTEDNDIKKSEDIYVDFEKIKEFLNIEDENIGEILLNRYFDKIGINCVKINNSAVLKLLEYMDLKKENSQRKNIQEFELEVGDLIKGTDIEFIEDILKNGIRAKEFFMEGKINSDATPLDSDFSEIKSENLAKDNLAGIIDSTYTGRAYGETWIVIKNNNYNSEDRDLNYAEENGANSTRYFRTGIGSTNISAIITAEWNDELKFVLAQNEFYIPVKDFETEKILFTFDEYQKIRQQMRGLTHYGADEFVISENANNENILNQASELRKKAEGEISTEEKREKIISQLRSKFKKVLLTEIGGDISKETIELIDTGSTGRGTNIPGDGDFDFMLKCSSIEEQKELIKEIKTILVGNEKGGTNEFNIRYTDVKIEGLEPTVEVDITTQSKRLETEYTSDMCIREKLDSIKRTYGDEHLNVVIDNILVAKKVLKENGIYKKTGSVGSTEYGGFGGIGVENWILQNGGSFINAMQTFLENTVDEDGNEIEFEKFKKRYPIYDFGQNHMYKKGNSGDKREHDHYIEGLSECGFTKMKEFFKTLLAEYNLEQSKESNKEKFFDSIIDGIKEPDGYKMSDTSQIYGLLAKMRAYCITKESKGENLKI